jgi:hypothetical protein
MREAPKKIVEKVKKGEEFAGSVFPAYERGRSNDRGFRSPESGQGCRGGNAWRSPGLVRNAGLDARLVN